MRATADFSVTLAHGLVRSNASQGTLQGIHTMYLLSTPDLRLRRPVDHTWDPDMSEHYGMLQGTWSRRARESAGWRTPWRQLAR